MNIIGKTILESRFSTIIFTVPKVPYRAPQHTGELKKKKKRQNMANSQEKRTISKDQPFDNQDVRIS